ncbi:hypothetical protein DER29_2564 [Micromonospora sp. M71_S20]|uniref:hypothetical protein n=1 Tax=Micromonospora sp. M71_S20 TaxID=592872 RepID=UPI000EB345AC|nr:hypothetical protein [Micromonospora sp. M71_S20]RLK24646.1 hypothetical protein DER29_2564 [Micromonospora sp. M71_S20]
MSAPERSVSQDPATDYLRAVREGELPPDLPARTAARVLTPDIEAQSFHRVMFVDERELASFYADFTVLLDVVGRLPHLLAGGSTSAFGALTDVPAVLRPLLAGTDLPALVPYGRADLIHDGTGFKVLELGLSPAVGGAERTAWLPAVMAEPAFRPFAERHGLRHPDPVTALLDVLRTVETTGTGHDAEAPGPAEVLMVEATGALEEWADDWRPLGDCLEAYSDRPLRTRLAEVADLHEPDGSVANQVAGVTHLLRLFNLTELAEEPDPVLAWQRLHPAPGSALPPMVTSPVHDMYNSKACLALVWLPEVQDALTDGERAALRRILPETIHVDAATDLTGFVRDRAVTILKPTTLARGEGTVAGWTVDDETWQAALASAAENGRHILQRRVVQRAEPGFDTDGVTERDWYAVWGMHYGPGGCTGFSCRLTTVPGAVVRGITNVLLAPVLLHPGA